MHFDPERITFIGRTDARGRNVAFGIKAKDRQRHVYVIGKTGMGKSTLLENMAIQDIQNGEGMAFIDPHGSAAEKLLNYIPEHRINDVLYFSPADASYPVSFNIMEDVGEDKRHLVVSGLMSVFKKIWVDAWSARMEYILSNTLLALLEYPGSTLLGVNRMLSDKDYRNKVVANVRDPGVRSFWVDEFAKYNERYMQEAGDAIKNKIGQFTANPIIRNIIGQPKSSFDIRQIMDEKKIIIMNLSKGLIGETNANLLGSMLTTRIYLAAMSRADLPPEKMHVTPNFYFYVDEFQSFANATFANILSEARKYHLNLTIAHQYIEQMEEEVRNAVFGNVGTTIAFRVGPFDAEVLETIFTPQFLATDIVNLGFAQVYLTLMIDGIGSAPFSATTLPPIAPQPVSYKDMVIAASRRSYAKDRLGVEQEILKFHEPIVVEKVVRPSRTDREGENGRRETAPRTELPKEEKIAPREQREEKPEQRQEQRPEQRQERRDHTKQRKEEDRTQQRVSEPQQRNNEQRRDRPKTAPTLSHEERSPKKNPTDHLSDLRSILKKVVATESPQAPPSTVIANPEPKPAVKRSGVEQDASSPKADVPPRESDVRNVVSVPTKEEKPVTIERVEENRVTPKELERMMRITTNDKPPF